MVGASAGCDAVPELVQRTVAVLNSWFSSPYILDIPSSGGGRFNVEVALPDGDVGNQKLRGADEFWYPHYYRGAGVRL